MEFPTTIQGLLDALQTPGLIAIVVGWLWSQVVEYVPAWANLQSKYKRLVFLGLSLLIPVIALAISCGAATCDADSWYRAITAGIISFGSGTIAFLSRPVKNDT